MKTLRYVMAVMLMLTATIVLVACGDPVVTGGENEWKWVVQPAEATSDVTITNPWDNMETESAHGNYRGTVGIVKLEGLTENEYAIYTMKFDVNLSDFDITATQNKEIGFTVGNVHTSETKPELYLKHWNFIGEEYPDKTKLVSLHAESDAYYSKFFNLENYVEGDAIIVDVTKDITIDFSYMSTDGTIKDITVLIEAAKITGK